MLTFTTEHYCQLVYANRLEEAGRQELGRENGLCVCCLSQGRGSIGHPEQANLLLPGSVIAAGGQVEFYPVGPVVLEVACFSGMCAHELAPQLVPPMVLPSAGGSQAGQLLYQLVEGNAKGLLSSYENSALGYSLLCALAQAQPGEEKPVSSLVAAAVALMHSHYGDVYGVEEVAEELMVSKCHLIRCFTKEVGISPGRYLTTVRLDAACRLLLQPEITLEMVAGLSGFSGANYLCRVFKKEYGQTPLQWKKARQPAAEVSHAQTEWEESLYL